MQPGEIIVELVQGGSSGAERRVRIRRNLGGMMYQFQLTQPEVPVLIAKLTSLLPREGVKEESKEEAKS